LSSWEVLTLSKKGRLSLRPSPTQWIQDAWRNAPVREAPFTQEVAMATEEIVLPHRDPVDLFLAATARVYGLTLITSDSDILAGTGFKALANL
jgi:PIN domain nuclease of toxin-antitoxin system